MSAASCSRSTSSTLQRSVPDVMKLARIPRLSATCRPFHRCFRSGSSGVLPGILRPNVTSLSSASCGASASPPSNANRIDYPLILAFEASAKLIAATLQLAINIADKAKLAFAAAFPQLAAVNAEDVKHQLQQIQLVSSSARLLAFVAPFAKAAASESLTAVYTRTFERAAFGFAKMYLFCLFMRVLLSWFPSIDWNEQPWTFLRLITEPYLQIYRGILPPLFGQLDFTPLFGFLILQDVVEVMAPTYTMGMHAVDTSTRWTTSDVMCYFDGF